MAAWSYSSIKTFDQCPKKYFHLKVAKDVKDPPGEEALYGSAVHEAAELYIKDGTPIPAKFGYMAPIVETLNKLKGDKHAELQLGIQRNSHDSFAPCGFDDAQAWWRGIADLLVVDGYKAHCVDYKTGKNPRYADTKQLDLLAAAVFLHFPEVAVIKSSLIFVVAGTIVPKVHNRADLLSYMNVFKPQLEALEAATESGVWNPKSSPLCGWCPVTECPHWRPKRVR